MRHSKTKKKPLMRLTAFLLTAVMLMGIPAFPGIGGSFAITASAAVNLNAPSVFLKQTSGGTCTLTAVAMLVRRTALATGNKNWKNINQSTMRSTAWIEGLGIRNSFTYAGISVESDKLPGGKANTAALIKLLKAHPEGIVLYDRDSPHAVLLTDCTNGVFYCADPARGYASGRIPLSRACDVSATNADKYWYVSSPDVVLDGASVFTYVPGTYTVTADGGLNLRSAARTSAEIRTVIPCGEAVIVTRIHNGWGYTSYGGFSGWICLDYASYAPNAVTGFTAVKKSATAIALGWEKQSAVKGYQIFNCVTGKVITVKNPSTVSCVIGSLTPGRAYNFRIRAYNTIAKRNYYSAWSDFLKTNTIPATVVISSLTSEAAGSMTVDWAGVANAAGYEVLYSESKDFSGAVRSFVPSGNAVIDSLSGSVYYVRVRAYSLINGARVYGSFSAVKAVRV